MLGNKIRLANTNIGIKWISNRLSKTKIKKYIESLKDIDIVISNIENQISNLENHPLLIGVGDFSISELTIVSSIQSLGYTIPSKYCLFSIFHSAGISYINNNYKLRKLNYLYLRRDLLRLKLFSLKSKNKEYKFHIIRIGKKKRKIVVPDNQFRIDNRYVVDFLYRCKTLVPISIQRQIKRSVTKTVKEINSRSLKYLDRLIIKIDIKSAFSSTKERDVLNIIQNKIPIKSVEKVIKTIKEAISACFYKEELPQGYPTSPILYHINTHGLEKALNKQIGLFFKLGVQIIRYVDDIIIVGINVSNSNKKEIADKVNAFKFRGYRINKKKTRIIISKGNLSFLSYNILQNNSFRKKISRRIRNKIRMSNYNLTKDSNNDRARSIKGSLEYMSNVE